MNQYINIRSAKPYVNKFKHITLLTQNYFKNYLVNSEKQITFNHSVKPNS